ncbi:MAG: hypothetical protein IPK93_10570 [Solirubrobacterales bacterium]|nr:hypothetical protein [Solirubrobacterales bacterium]
MGEILDNDSASIEQDGKLSDVVASIYDGTDAGFGVPSWWGKYDDANDNEPVAGKARIKLPDGRSGEIIVRVTRHGTGSGEFRGTGELS